MRPPIHAALASLAAAAVLTAPLYAHRDRWGIFDWDQKLMEEAQARQAILAHGELALWNPSVGGGKSAVGDPLSRHLSPLFLPVLLFGELLGCRISITLHLALGIALAYALARDLGLPPLPSALAALVGFGNGAMAWHLAYGHYEWISAAFVPGALLFARRAGRASGMRIADLLGGGACLAMMLLEGGVYLLPPTIFTMAAAAAVTAILERRAAPLIAVAAVGIVALQLAAVKLIPVAETAHMHPRAFDGARRAISFHEEAGVEGSLPAQVWELFLRPTSREDSIVYRTDASCHVGIFVTLLMIAGALRATRTMLPLLLPGAALLWLHLGPFLPWDPWTLLGTLGPMRALRFPERFIEVAAIAGGLVAAAGLQAIARGRRAVEASLLAVVALALVTPGWPLYLRAFTRDPAPVTAAGPFRQVGFPAHSTYHTFREGLGADRGYDVTPRQFYVKHEGEPGYRGEAFIRSGRGEARIVRLTANRIEVEVQAPPGGVLLVVNQNYDPGFLVEGAAAPFVRSEEGLLAAPVRAGLSRVTFRYRPPGFLVGALVSGASLLGLGALALRERRRSGAAGAGANRASSGTPS